MTTNDLFNAIEQWGFDRLIIQNSQDCRNQFLKLVSEIGELGDALAKGDDDEIGDAIGDSIVVLTMIAAIHARMKGATGDEPAVLKCIADAYAVIRHRKGHLTPGGVFVKEPE